MLGCKREIDTGWTGSGGGLRFGDRHFGKRSVPCRFAIEAIVGWESYTLGGCSIQVRDV